jgi:peptidoglycan hydrolase-like protein with peptidoglycan-binding domain
MNRSRKNLKIRKIATGIPRGTIFLGPNNEEIASKNIVHKISLEATNSAINKIMRRNLGDQNLFSRIFRVKNFAGGVNQLVIYIGITDKDKEVGNNTATVDTSSVIPHAVPGFHQEESKFMTIVVHFLDLYDPSRERYPNNEFIYNYIKEILEHELIHASEAKVKDGKINELSNIEDPNDPLSSFHYTTREEIAAYLRQITVELEHDLTNNDFKSLSIDEILERSHTLPGILESLKQTEDIKTPFGSLNRRKDAARKKFLSALYSWVIDKKESLKDNDGHKVSRLRKLKLFLKIASENTLDQFLRRDDLPIFEKTSPKELVRSVQKNLISAGYDLPRYGADGDFGRETETAILRFKQDHGISGDGKSLEQSDVLKLNSAANFYNQGRQRARSLREILNQMNGLSEPEGDTLLFGDSQMQGGIGDVLVSKYPGKRLSKVGSQAQFWVNNPELEAELEKLPSNIIIQLNSNGISGTKALLKKIKDITPNSNIRWYGAPPATISRSSWSPKVRTPDSLRSFNEAREANNTKVVAMLSSSGLNFEFINPFEIRGFTSWTCSGCDGIHVPKSVAQKYYARV